ncbi:type II toxin-antitoxin system CcdA family antitoxin [Rhizobiaceae bacterium CRRU44]|uniref:Type II toxin-antitoxin system CcdA family antitoxin n=1 Tax=Ferranicluibacter rubi TaxID=2715133 RepID=A0AA44CAT8_9HYPH|nr:type II toxin-antitoxin system CcdA family antitoxin [Ferranicluibacter rubi]NHT74706.1 type II toxin-antitoxin system CcdA family antitoxin [Ferranicluibacter rubi]
MSQTARIRPDVSLDDKLVADALELNIDISSAAADGVAKAVKAERERLWLIENAEAFRAERAYIETHGLPLAKYRQF